jgi:hypothetical protein
MSKNIFLCSLLMLVLAMAPFASAGKVELTTYYPAPFGEYQNINSTGNSNFATTSGGVAIGTTTVAPGNEQLRIETAEGDWGVTLSRGGGVVGGIHSNGGVLTLANGVGAIRLNGAAVVVSGPLSVGAAGAALAVQDGRNIRLDVTDNIRASDVYLSNPQNGAARWVSQAGISEVRIWCPAWTGAGNCPTGWTYAGSIDNDGDAVCWNGTTHVNVHNTDTRLCYQ